MKEHRKLLRSIASTVADYRTGDLDAPTPEHVYRWVTQFDVDFQLPILREMEYVLKRTYFSRRRVTKFLRALIKTSKLVGTDPCTFWQSVNFLDIQGAGNSQTEMLALFGEVLQTKCGIGIEQCGGESATHLYLDDGVFTGNRVLQDLRMWIEERAPSEATLHIVSIVLHSGGEYYARKGIDAAAKIAGKKILITLECKLHLV